jgi:pimeloyl-ACP methyl ester carboxylesterase
MDWWPGSTRRWDASADPAKAVEGFIRGVAGDAAWEGLPVRVREERISEGPAMLAEFGDLASNQPWSFDEIAVPVRAMYGENGAEHHHVGAEYVAARLSDMPAIEVAGAAHNAPSTHPQAIATAISSLAALSG